MLKGADTVVGFFARMSGSEYRQYLRDTCSRVAARKSSGQNPGGQADSVASAAAPRGKERKAVTKA